MFDPTSRYARLEVARHQTAEGREVAYVRRRWVPAGPSLPLLAAVRVADGDRLDVLAARTLGVPEAFWRIADANDALVPDDLTATPGRRLRIPMPQPL